LEVGVNITVLNYTICLASLCLIVCVCVCVCVLQYLTLNKLEMVVTCEGESAEGKVCGMYHSPAPRRLKTLDRLAGIQIGCFLNTVRLSSWQWARTHQ